MGLNAITPDDRRYETLKKGFNLRWPAAGQAAGGIIICSDEAEVVAALQYALDHKLKPTIRSGGHCYEGFVSNNPGGLIIDIGQLSGLRRDVAADGRRYGFQLLAGNQNWDGYVGLYKLTGKTMPGGSCYSVGAGGHISGGGYGLLSRLQGLTVDWLSAVDILLADGGKVRKVHARVDNEFGDLLKLCKGAGGGNVGLITSYYFDDLPPAPQQVGVQLLQFSWDDFKDLGRFSDLLQTYGQYWQEADSEPEGYGLFSLLKLTHISAKNLGLVVQYTDRDGKLNHTAPFNDFYRRIKQVTQPQLLNTYLPGGGHLPHIPHRSPPKNTGSLPEHTQAMDWLYATQTLNGSGSNQRGKYKSAYMKRNFSPAECKAIHQHLTSDPDNQDLAQSLLQVDSYGGAINHRSPGNNGFDPADNQTAVPQRASVMKLQYQSYWTDPANDAMHVSWMRAFFDAVYAADGFNGTPYPSSAALPDSPYEGCYINYPDVDMLNGARPGTPGYSWGELYYGALYPELVAIKRKYDPGNVFNHAMSLGAE